MPCPQRKQPPHLDCDECKKKQRDRMQARRLADPIGTRAVEAKWRLDNPQAFRDSEKRSRDKLRNDILTAYGSCCVCCGQDYSAYLEIDHINNDGNAHRRNAGGIRNVYRDLRNRNYPPIVQLLCANCHTAKTRGASCPPHES